MLLYEHPLSSYAQKVKTARWEKAVAFDVELPESFETGGSDGPFAAVNSRTEVPVLIDGSARIFGSTIMEYVEERWPDPPLRGAAAQLPPPRSGTGTSKPFSVTDTMQ